MRYYVTTSLGTIGIDAEEGVITGIDLDRLGSDPAPGHAELADAPPAVRDVAEWLVEYADDPTAPAPVGVAVIRRSLAESGIAGFTADALAALYGVPAGDTVSYGELARRAGTPAAARAAGRACARNPMPLLVPCHRVLPAGGGLGAFSAAGGTATKARLLAHEGVHVD